jgi:hypothetical protein
MLIKTVLSLFFNFKLAKIIYSFNELAFTILGFVVFPHVYLAVKNV